MKKISLPSISVLLYVYNEEDNLKRLLLSLETLSYPRDKIEYVAVDDGSTDGSAQLLENFGASVIKVKTHDVELNKGIAMYAAKNELVYLMDADMEICDGGFFNKLVSPLVDDPNIIGSLTREFALDCGPVVKNSFLRFISYDNTQRDPVYRFFSIDMEKTIIEKRDDYFLCEFVPGKIPASGRVLYRREELLKTAVGKNKSFIDLETLEIVARAGHRFFAFVPDAKIRHWHSFLGDQSGDYLPNIDKKYYLWFDHRNRSGSLKVIFWIIYANLFFPELVVGLVKAILRKDLAFLWQPIASIVVTDAAVYGFLVRPEGRNLAGRMIKNLIS